MGNCETLSGCVNYGKGGGREMKTQAPQTETDSNLPPFKNPTAAAGAKNNHPSRRFVCGGAHNLRLFLSSPPLLNYHSLPASTGGARKTEYIDRFIWESRGVRGGREKGKEERDRWSLEVGVCYSWGCARFNNYRLARIFYNTVDEQKC